ncbi:MAG: hypothetical protein JWP11_1160 [Frankiales bacterium]|nr:hypothetical protein [Frankiales bacterium]
MLLAGSGWLAVRGLAAKRELTAARAELATARSALLEQHLDAARIAISAAGIHTARGRTLTDDPVWKVASHIPLAGRSVAVVRSLSASADVLARQVLPGALVSAETLDPARVRRGDGSIDLAAVRRSQPGLDQLAEQTRVQRRRTTSLPTGLLLPPIARARREFADQLRQLDEAATAAARVAGVLPALLGGDRPRTYFVMVQQTSESRGTGGLTGGFAVLRATGGRLQVTAQGTDADLRNGPIPPPTGVPMDYIDLYADNGAFDLWQNVNLSPDLPVVARVVAARWRKQSGQAIDGVMTVDSLALADILRGSGPVDVGNGVTVAPEQLPDYLALGQYRDFPAISEQNARKERLGAVARLALQRLTAGAGSSADLARGLSDALRSGHLRMASDDPALRTLHNEGVDGSLPTGSAPVAYPVLFNASGGKLDYFIDRAVSYAAGACTGSRRRSHITVDLRNGAPATGLPPYVTIHLNQDGQRASYDDAVVLAVFTTRGAQFDGASLDGTPISMAPMGNGPYLSKGTEAGLPVWYLYLDLPRGETRRLVLDLNEPVSSGAARMPEQPLARPMRVTTRVPTCG